MTNATGSYASHELSFGHYSVKVEARGFAPRQDENVIAGLGQKQTVDFTLKVARSNKVVEVNSEAPLINPENANTSTTLNAPALEDLPNPGGDLTYPLQFAPGALINTAPSPTATSLMDWKRTTPSPISTAASPPTLCWG